MMKNDLIFVYGTLMSGFQGPYSLFLRKNAQLLGEASCRGYLYEISWYPGLVIAPEAEVVGELYGIHQGLEASFWAVLDEYEGVSDVHTLSGDEYSRREIEVTFEGGAVSAWAYIYTGLTVGKLITGGRFLPNKNKT